MFSAAVANWSSKGVVLGIGLVHGWRNYNACVLRLVVFCLGCVAWPSVLHIALMYPYHLMCGIAALSQDVAACVVCVSCVACVREVDGLENHGSVGPRITGAIWCDSVSGEVCCNCMHVGKCAMTKHEVEYALQASVPHMIGGWHWLD